MVAIYFKGVELLQLQEAQRQLSQATARQPELPEVEDIAKFFRDLGDACVFRKVNSEQVWISEPQFGRNHIQIFIPQVKTGAAHHKLSQEGIPCVILSCSSGQILVDPLLDLLFGDLVLAQSGLEVLLQLLSSCSSQAALDALQRISFYLDPNKLWQQCNSRIQVCEIIV